MSQYLEYLLTVNEKKMYSIYKLLISKLVN